MEITKEELQRKVDELTQSLDSFNKNTEMLKQDLAETKRKLKVADRPKVSSGYMDDINEAISEAISSIDFTDPNALDVDFEIDYDNRLALNSIEFNHVYDIADEIYSRLENLFNIISTEDEA